MPRLAAIVAPSVRALPLLLTLALLGCPQDNPGGDAGLEDDSGTRDDAGFTDAGFTDAGTDDAGTVTDAGMPDGFIVHYHRADADYTGWQLEVSGGTAAATLDAAGVDDFGARFSVPLNDGATSLTFRFVYGPQTDPSAALVVTLQPTTPGVWFFSGQQLPPLLRAPPAVPGPEQAVVYYLRDDSDYAPWGLHVWGDVVQETAWQAPLPQGGVDADLGAYWLVNTKPNAARVNFIVHQGDTKDPGPDMGFDLATTGNMIFMATGSTDVFPFPIEIPEFAIDGAAAHWLSPTTVAWNTPEGTTAIELRAARDASVRVDGTDVVGGTVTPLAMGAPLAGELAALFPHLAGRLTATLDTDGLDLRALLQGQLVVVARDAAGTALAATQVQTAGVIDALFTTDSPLGVTWSGGVPELRVWAPTAQQVRLRHFGEDHALLETLEMDEDSAGVWSFVGATAAWKNDYYQYEVQVFHPITKRVETFNVSDPYALSVSMNGQQAQLVDLNDAALMPAGFATLSKPPLAAPEDIVLYELHVRDFSANDATVAEAARGKFNAFLQNGTDAPLSDGMAHLQSIAAAGVTHLHLLPAFDVATIDEDPSLRVDIDDTVDTLCERNPAVPADRCNTYAGQTIRAVLGTLDPTLSDAGGALTAQELTGYMRSIDSFNWGYDPFHYTTPEGSYASNADGSARIKEMRDAVASLADSGLRVVLDVVYNHTNASGVGEKSVLDKVVPGYYHRLNTETGYVEKSTCCDNTATEHNMMERLMIDSVVVWASQYKIDAFRFDLMGHHMKRNMVKLRQTLDALTVENSGVDGSAIYLYGEGWNFGEVQNNARGVNATQANMGGTGIGTFNDRLRDGARGGSAFDATTDLRENQGFINGRFYAPNELSAATDANKTELFKQADLVRVGMAGNLRDFRLVRRDGTVRTGSQIAYQGAEAAYCDDPQEAINYVSKHDNQTLFDINAYKAPAGLPSSERVRLQALGFATILLGQGVPFVHAGDDLLRSKSMERDSYDSGDWYNRIDWSGADNNWNVGLPRKDKDGANWGVIRTVLADDGITPSATDIAATAAAFRDLVRVRQSTVLLRLRTKADVMARMDFFNVGPDQLPGVIAYSVSDGLCAGADLDPALDGLVGIINADDDGHDVVLAGATGYALHPLLADATDADARTQTAGFDDATDTFTVPARTAAVFVMEQSGAQRDGPACNTR